MAEYQQVNRNQYDYDSSSRSRSLIVGGHIVANDDDEYSAFAWTGIDGSAGWGCGGALIHNDIVLTAAHCQWVYGNGVYIGSSHLSKTFDGGNGQYYNTTKLLVQPKYNDKLHQNDILLVQINGNAATATSKPIPYNTNMNKPNDNEVVRVIGFGTTRENGNFSQDLRAVDVNIISSNTCADVWMEERQLPIIHDIHICAGTIQGGKDACDSDSGSPLFNLDSDTGRIISVIGIVGDGIGCGQPGKPGLYTRVSSYANWIEATICNISNYPPAHHICKKYDNYIPETLSPTFSPTEASLPKIIEQHHHHLHHIGIIIIGIIVLIYISYKFVRRYQSGGYRQIPEQSLTV